MNSSKIGAMVAMLVFLPVAVASASVSNPNASGLMLDAGVVQYASESTGVYGDDAGVSPSATDSANFINFCRGKTLTNGVQNRGASCNGIVMGEIPSTDNMISTIIVYPKNGEILPRDVEFTVQIQVSNLAAGSFTNPQNTYLSAPQHLSGNGKVVGNVSAIIQSLANENPTNPPNPSTFAFLKSIRDDGNGQGLLSAKVVGGLPAGIYRLCTEAAASNHQPVLMPTVQRGAQNDCIRFSVADDKAKQ